MWGDGSGLDEALAAYTTGDDRRWDERLLRWDVIGTLGHAAGLRAAGLLDATEHRALRRELCSALADALAGDFRLSPDDEDAHSALEHRLVERLGATGERVHTGRSRNDQVATALRLCLKDELSAVQDDAAVTAQALIEFGRRHAGVVMPGFTHLRRAMPSSVGLWAAGYAEALLDDLGLLQAVFVLADRGPLGSAAGYGVPLPLDREAVSRSLGFASPQVATTATQLSRGKLEAAILGALWAVGKDLASLSWDVVLFSADEYGYFVLPDKLCTGSSIMPQKRNPDIFELTRGRAGVLAGLAVQAMAVCGSLPGGYQRDLQLTKGPVLEGIDTLRSMLAMMTRALPLLGVDEARCLAHVSGDLLATDEVYRRVRAGQAFRSAYRDVAAEVKAGIATPALGAEEILQARRGLGGAGAPALEVLAKRAQAERRRVSRQDRDFAAAIAALGGDEA